MPISRRGFTLMEMMVVISIITLLISITLPALSKSRLVAREATCGSNARQATIAFTSYTGDNSQYYPDFSYDPAAKKQWQHPNYWTQSYWRTHMLSYGLIREIIYSPSNEIWNRDDFYWYNTADPDNNIGMVMGYFYFGSTLVNTSAYRSSLMVSVPKMPNIFPRRNGGVSHHDILWADLNRQQGYHIGTWLSPDDSRRWGSNHWYGQPDQRVSGSHRAFTDNHVEFVTEPEFRLQSTYAGLHMYW